MAALQTLLTIVKSLSHYFPQLPSLRHQAKMFRDNAISHKIDYVVQLGYILNYEGFLYCIIGSKGMYIFLDRANVACWLSYIGKALLPTGLTRLVL